MCGIAGFIGPGTREDLARMTRRLVDRGPDAAGDWEGDGVLLGHRRLSILDLEGGAQPMWSADESCGIVFNGEIYNYAELRADLAAAGRVFRTDHSDTEVLLEAYAEWGDGMVHRLNGMWAFVIFDRGRRRLFASRDRFGKKPFYYHHSADRGCFVFASELNALLEHPGVPRGVSAPAVRKYFAYGYVPAPLAMTEGTKKLPGGHSLSVDIQTSELRVWRYWDYQPEPDAGGSPAEWREELRGVLGDAVRRRMVADVPLGVFLSGGIDSSLVAALAAKDLPRGGLQTFSIGFDEPTYDELPFAARVAEWIGSRHRTETLNLANARGLLPEIYSRLDEPNGDSSLLPTFLLSKFTRREVTVALGGDGGDELFAGYEPFRALHAAAFYRSLVPKALHPAIISLADRLPVSHRYLSLDFALKRFVRGAARPPSQWIPTWMAGMDAPDLQDCFGGADMEEVFSEAIEAWDGIHSEDPVEKATGFFIRLYLQDSVLAKVDRASMMSSLEVRAPFLDINVVNLARRIPSAWRLRGGCTKYLLKEAARGLLPDEIIDRKKKGFGVPVGAWFRSGDMSIDPAAMPCPSVAARLLSEHSAGIRNHRLFLWNAWVYGEWKRRTGIA
ncbi:MAG: asparagine synthase (glutamine-hydrolyzing) [Chthoniobacterales bacterium]|nr:asparagine synthase (glutamine-hydrolyzing) [Chthoniobacterales bacterium]